jgi:serine protease inhibitor
MTELTRFRSAIVAAAAVLAITCPVPAQQTGASADPALIAAAQAQLGFRLIEKLERDGTARPNGTVSPASLAGVFAFIDIVADAKLREGLVKSLGFASADAEASFAALRAAASRLREDTSSDNPLAFANAMFVDPDLRPIAGGLDKLKAAGGEVFVLKLTDDAGIAEVNAWVSKRTRTLIPSILERPLDRAGFVALNALYFKDRWKFAFDPNATRPTPFQLVGADPVEVAMMHLGETRLPFRQDDRFVAVELPYASDRFSLVIATTKDKPAAVSEFAPIADWLAGPGSSAEFKEQPGLVSMPKFAMTMSADLLKALDDMGLMAGRQSDTAFQGLTPVATDIVQILQRTVIRLDEAGTEAAAATAVVGLARAARPEPADRVRMVVDKPFMFALRERDSGLILLAGYVGRPEAP